MASSKQTVLITGCSAGGIGHALALAFHARGLHVIATARRQDTMSDLASSGIETISLDVNDEASIRELADRLSSQATLDLLIHNAGRNYTVPALDIEMSEVRETFETNVFAPMRLTQALAPKLIAAADGARGESRDSAPPTILVIGSAVAHMPYVFGSVYNASKAAVHQWANTLRIELAPFGVRVVVAVTGGVHSRIARYTRELPAESLYLPVQTEYNERQIQSQTLGIPTEEYAASVVDQILRPGPAGNEGGLAVWRVQRDIWAGGKIWVVWLVTKFLSTRFFDYAFARMFKLEKIKAAAGGVKKRD